MIINLYSASNLYKNSGGDGSYDCTIYVKCLLGNHEVNSHHVSGSTDYIAWGDSSSSSGGGGSGSEKLVLPWDGEASLKLVVIGSRRKRKSDLIGSGGSGGGEDEGEEEIGYRSVNLILQEHDEKTMFDSKLRPKVSCIL